MNNLGKILTEGDYCFFIRRELEKRRAHNPKYSMRAFARDIKIKPDRLISILGGRFGLSPKAAAEVAQNLRLGDEEATLFCQLVARRHARSRKEREQAERGFQNLLLSFQDLQDIKILVNECLRRLSERTTQEINKEELSRLLNRPDNELASMLHSLRKLERL